MSRIAIDLARDDRLVALERTTTHELLRLGFRV